MTARNIVGLAVALLFPFTSTASAGYYTFEDLYPQTWQVNSGSQAIVAAPPGSIQGRNASLAFQRGDARVRAAAGSRSLPGRFRAPLVFTPPTVIGAELELGNRFAVNGDNSQSLLLQSVALLLSSQSVEPVRREPVPVSLELAGLGTSPRTPEPTTVIVLAIAGFIFFLPRR